MRNRVKWGKNILLKLFFHTQQCHGKTSKQEGWTIAFINQIRVKQRNVNRKK